jgi:propionate CoA-transferase
MGILSQKLCTADDAISLIQSGQTVATSGFVGAGHPEALTAALERRFLREAQPTGLTLFYAAGQGDRQSRGLDHLAHVPLLRRVIGGHWGMCPRLGQMALTGDIEAYNLPQGVLCQLYRDIAAGRPGHLTQVGLGTFVDPVDGNGGKLNSRTVVDLVSRFSLPDVGSVLWYKSLPIHVALIRATSADPLGNLLMANEAVIGEVLAMAQSAKNSGGIVLAQVEELWSDCLYPHDVRVPGVLVDCVILANPLEHPQTFGECSTDFYSQADDAGFSPLPISRPLDRARRAIATRALQEIPDGAVVNLGIGIPEAIAQVAAEHDRLSSLTLTVESGTIGGQPASGLAFGASRFPQAIIDSPSQFDWYDGGGIDVACLGMAEVDQAGNVNVSKFGERFAGVGGFINISSAARKVVFCGMLTVGDGQKKFVRQVEQVCFNAAESRKRGQEVLYVTEQAVFRLAADGSGLELLEIAPGLDEHDVFRQMGFAVPVADGWRVMSLDRH